MSVPIHNLYDYIYQVLEKRYFLYYFYPFGQKELFNLIAYVNTLSDDYKDNSKILYTQMNSFHFPDENYITALKIFPKDTSKKNIKKTVLIPTSNSKKALPILLSIK